MYTTRQRSQTIRFIPKIYSDTTQLLYFNLIKQLNHVNKRSITVYTYTKKRPENQAENYKLWTTADFRYNSNNSQISVFSLLDSLYNLYRRRIRYFSGAVPVLPLSRPYSGVITQLFALAKVCHGYPQLYQIHNVTVYRFNLGATAVRTAGSNAAFDQTSSLAERTLGTKILELQKINALARDRPESTSCFPCSQQQLDALRLIQKKSRPLLRHSRLDLCTRSQTPPLRRSSARSCLIMKLQLQAVVRGLFTCAIHATKSKRCLLVFQSTTLFYCPMKQNSEPICLSAKKDTRLF